MPAGLVRDVTALLGLGLVALGVGIWSVPLALVVTGTVLLAVALLGSLRGDSG